MSDSEGDEAPQIKEPVVMPPKTFFISHINSYTGKVLKEELAKNRNPDIDISQYKFHGTLEKGINNIYTATDGIVPEGVEKVVQMSRTREFRESILASDVIIYDLMSNDFSEVDYVIKTLKTNELKTEKTLIILSSVMTWVNTLPKLKVEGEEDEAAEGEEEKEDSDEFSDAEEWAVEDSDEKPEEEGAEEDEEAKKPPEVLYLKESDRDRRVPHERYIPHKNLETLALSAPKTQKNLKVHVLCCGIRYGHGEGAFFNHYK